MPGLKPGGLPSPPVLQPTLLLLDMGRQSPFAEVSYHSTRVVDETGSGGTPCCPSDVFIIGALLGWNGGSHLNLVPLRLAHRGMAAARFGMWASRSLWAEPGSCIANRAETEPGKYYLNIPQLNARAEANTTTVYAGMPVDR